MLSGVDSKLLVLKHSNSTFKTCVGVNVVYDGDYESFSDIYDSALETAFERSDFKRQRTIYKSYEILKQFAEQKEQMLEVLGDFFENLFSRDGIEIRIVFTRFSKKALDGQNVRCYESSPRKKELELNDFIDQLKSYFPAIAATETLEQDEEVEVFLDNFSGQVTKGWDSLINNHEVTILTNGDKVNKLVSVADLLVKYLEIYINRYKDAYIDEDTISSVLNTEKLSIYEMNNQHLSYIVPHRPDDISVAKHYPRPMFFVILDNEFGNEKNWFENSKYYDLVCEAAESRRSAVKFLDIDADAQIVKENDFLVYTGTKSKEEAERISSFDLGKPIPKENIKDISHSN